MMCYPYFSLDASFSKSVGFVGLFPVSWYLLWFPDHQGVQTDAPPHEFQSENTFDCPQHTQTRTHMHMYARTHI